MFIECMTALSLVCATVHLCNDYYLFLVLEYKLIFE